MKNYACKECGSVDVFIKGRGEQKALVCGDCNTWQKWIGKKEMPLVERFIQENKQAPVKELGKELSLRIIFSEDMKQKILEVNGVDVSDKNIYL